MQHTSDHRRSRSASGSLDSSIDADVNDYLLPHTTSAASEKKPPYARRRQLRCALGALLILVSAVLVWIWLFLKGRVVLAEPILRALAKETGLPPLYTEFHQMELNLPQHNMVVSDSSDVKYLWIANHIRGATLFGAYREVYSLTVRCYREWLGQRDARFASKRLFGLPFRALVCK